MDRETFTATIGAFQTRRPFKPFTVAAGGRGPVRSRSPERPRGSGTVRRFSSPRATCRCSSTTRALAKSSATCPAAGPRLLDKTLNQRCSRPGPHVRFLGFIVAPAAPAAELSRSASYTKESNYAQVLRCRTYTSGPVYCQPLGKRGVYRSLVKMVFRDFLPGTRETILGAVSASTLPCTTADST